MLLAPIFFVASQGEIFLPYLSILKILRILWRIEKWVKNTKKKLTPRPDLWVQSWLMGA